MVFFLYILALCATPKRCCSSITEIPKLLNTTVSSISACVPIRISISPNLSLSNIAARFFPLTDPVNNSTFIPKG